MSSIAAYPMASKAHRWGPVRALRVAGTLAFLLCILLATSARSAGTPSICLRGGEHRLVAALMLAGIVGSAFEGSIGWRSAFVLSGIAAVLLTPLVKSVAEATPNRPAADHPDSIESAGSVPACAGGGSNVPVQELTDLLKGMRRSQAEIVPRAMPGKLEFQ